MSSLQTANKEIVEHLRKTHDAINDYIKSSKYFAKLIHDNKASFPVMQEIDRLMASCSEGEKFLKFLIRQNVLDKTIHNGKDQNGRDLLS